MSTIEQRIRLAELLEDVASGRTSGEEALHLTQSADWGDIPWQEQTIDLAWHHLEHFQIDEDIRAKDSAYDSAMKRRLLEYAARLRSEKLDERPGWWWRWFRGRIMPFP